MTLDVIEAAVTYLSQGGEAPETEAVVAALLAAEKHSKQAKVCYAYESFVGSWRLGFVSGTQTIRPRPQAKPVKRPAKGRYLPKLVKIQITYGANEEGASGEDSTFGTVKNSVITGPLQLCLIGPTRFWPRTNSLAFDFTNIQLKIGALSLYNGAVRGGSGRDQTFKAQSLKDQAFFTFFCVCDRYIAARGKGGGLALWTKADG